MNDLDRTMLVALGAETDDIEGERRMSVSGYVMRIRTGAEHSFLW